MTRQCRGADRPVVAVGIDTTDVSQVAESLARHQDRYLRFVLSTTEHEEALHAPDLGVDVARRWSAKEAVTKVLGPASEDVWRWPDVEVLGMPGSDTKVTLHGRAAELATRLGISRFEITEHQVGPVSVTTTAVGLGSTDRAHAREQTTERHWSS